MEKSKRDQRFHSTGKGSPHPCRQSKVGAAGGFQGNHPRLGLRYFPEKPCTAGARTFGRPWNGIPFRSINHNEKRSWT